MNTGAKETEKVTKDWKEMEDPEKAEVDEEEVVGKLQKTSEKKTGNKEVRGATK